MPAPASAGSQPTIRRTSRALAKSAKRVRKRTGHDAADSPLTFGSSGCPNDCWKALELPQAACGPLAPALEDAFAARAVLGSADAIPPMPVLRLFGNQGSRRGYADRRNRRVRRAKDSLCETQRAP